MKKHTPIALAALFLLLVSGSAYAEDAPPAPDARPAAPTLPASVDLRPQLEAWGLGPVGQGRRPTCSVFTVVAAMEAALARARGQGERLSVEFANWAGNVATKRIDDGSFFSDVWAGYEQHGICPDKAWPYQKSWDKDLAPPQDAKKAAEALKTRFSLRLHWIAPLPKKPGITRAHLDEIRRVLASGLPVCGGSYHSVLFVGYEDDPEAPGGGRLILKDSGGRGQWAAISYEAAMKRFGDVLWIEAVPSEGR